MASLLELPSQNKRSFTLWTILKLPYFTDGWTGSNSALCCQCKHTYIQSFIHSYIHTYRHASIRTYVRTYIHRYIQYMTHFGPITIRLTSLKFHLKLPYMKISPPRSLKLLEGWLSPSLAGAGGSAQVFRGQWKGQEAIPRSGEWMFEPPLFGVFEAFVPTKLGGFMDHS